MAVDRKNDGKPIPDDWDGQDYSLWMLCAPNSPRWDGFIRGAIQGLAYGPDWDGKTGNIKDTQAIAWEVYDSMAKCDDLVNVMRVNNAILAGEVLDLSTPVPQNYDYTENGIGPILSKYLIHLEALGAIPGDGDTIQDSLIKLVDSTGWDDRTIDELIAEIGTLDPGLIDTLSDLANLLIAYKAIFPGTTRVTVAHSFFEKIQTKRYWHNHLSIEAYQATALRGIQRALTPFDEDDTVDDEGNTLNKIFSIPFLAKALVAVVEPSPGGEVTLAGSLLSGVVKDAYEVIRSAWNIWWEKWINRVGNPVPVDTVTGSLSAIADAIANFSPVDQQEADSSGISASITALAGILGVEGAALVAAVEGLDAQVNVDVNCSSCGSSGGCGCGGGGGVPSQPATETDPPPNGWETPTDDEDNPIGPGDTAYSGRKCAVSNILHAQVVAIVTTTSSNSTILTMLPSSPSYSGGGYEDALLPIIRVIVGGLDLIGRTFSYMTDLAFSLFNADIDLDALATSLSENEEELVCALVNADNSPKAISDYLQILEDDGINVATRAVVAAILTYDTVNMLYFADSSLSLAIEDTIRTYDPPVPCGVCCDHVIGTGQDGNPYGVVVSDNGSTITIDSNFSDQSNRVGVALNGSCNTPYTISNVTVTSGTIDVTGLTFSAWRFFSPGASGSVGDIYDSDALPAGSHDNVHGFSVHSAQPFTVQFDYVEYVAP